MVGDRARCWDKCTQWEQADLLGKRSHLVMANRRWNPTVAEEARWWMVIRRPPMGGVGGP
ncbi:hypothetical protein AKJ16_DCAP16158 [Drosera capensis]